MLPKVEGSAVSANDLFLQQQSPEHCFKSKVLVLRRRQCSVALVSSQERREVRLEGAARRGRARLDRGAGADRGSLHRYSEVPHAMHVQPSWRR